MTTEENKPHKHNDDSYEDSAIYWHAEVVRLREQLADKPPPGAYVRKNLFDWVCAERDATRSRRDIMLSERDEARAELAALESRNEAMRAERDALLLRVAELEAERDDERDEAREDLK